MKKPPYKVYKKKRGEETPPIKVPEKIDTPQAEQLVSDFYTLLDFLSRHSKKIGAALGAVLLIGAIFFGYRFYTHQQEMKAARIVDEALYYLDKGEKEKALTLLERAVKEVPQAPSSKLASFLVGKLKGEEKPLISLAAEESYLLSPPSKTSLYSRAVDGEKRFSAYEVSREEWTHPEYLYYRLLIALKEGKKKEAENIYDILSGDYGSLPISSLAKRVIEVKDGV